MGEFVYKVNQCGLIFTKQSKTLTKFLYTEVRQVCCKVHQAHLHAWASKWTT